METTTLTPKAFKAFHDELDRFERQIDENEAPRVRHLVRQAFYAGTAAAAKFVVTESDDELARRRSTYGRVGNWITKFERWWNR